MSNLRRYWNRFSDLNTFWGVLTSDTLLPYSVGALAWTLTICSALFSSVPIPYLFASAFLAAGGATTAMLRADEWWARVNPGGKFVFVSPFFGYDLAENNGIIFIKNIQWGITFENKSNFTIKYRVEEIFSMFHGRVPVEDHTDKKEYEVAPGMGITFKDAVIAVDMPLTEINYYGKLKFCIVYYRNEAKEFRVNKNISITAKPLESRKDVKFSWRYQ